MLTEIVLNNLIQSAEELEEINSKLIPSYRDIEQIRNYLVQTETHQFDIVTNELTSINEDLENTMIGTSNLSKALVTITELIGNVEDDICSDVLFIKAKEVIGPGIIKIGADQQVLDSIFTDYIKE